ncbi:MAG: hypothetical protein JXR83_16600 [Deltaproteobacteria bacterium]|nr:hypothetical protein [Deltaproteobacteria bacterium]
MSRPATMASGMRRAVLALAGIAAGAGCAPALDAAAPPGYLARAPAAVPGRFGASAAGGWLLMVGRLEPQPEPLCSDPECRARGLARAVRELAGRGVEAAIVPQSDAALLRQPEVAAALRGSGLILLNGRSWSTDHGVDLTLVEPSTAASAPGAGSAPAVVEDWRARLERVRAAGGVAILHRPCQQRAAVARLLAEPGAAELLTAVEVEGTPIVDPACDRRQWHGWLRQGQRWLGLARGSELLGGSDARAFNLVAVDERTPEALLRALAAGRSQLVYQARHRPRIEIGLTTDGDGQLEALSGRQPVVVAGESVVVQLRAVGGRGGELLLYTEVADGPIERLGVDSSDAIASLWYPVPEGRVGFLRAELYRGGDVVAAANPIFFARAPAPDALPQRDEVAPSAPPG